jgi:hypothetical protein
MKTFDEMLEAMRAVAMEANESGFSFCAAIAPSNSNPDPVTTIFCGESLKLVALAEVIKANVFERNKFADITSE